MRTVSFDAGERLEDPSLERLVDCGDDAEAFEARALQHEIDHCQGLLFLDRVAGAHAIHQRKTYL